MCFIFRMYSILLVLIINMRVYKKIYAGVAKKTKFKKGVATVKGLRNTGLIDLQDSPP